VNLRVALRLRVKYFSFLLPACGRQALPHYAIRGYNLELCFEASLEIDVRSAYNPTL